MKLESIIVGEHLVEIDIAHLEREHALEFTATCGEYQRVNRMTLPMKHDYAESQFAEDIRAHAQRLSEEVAGAVQAIKLVKGFVKG